jgi:hypothetical protein
MLRLITGPWFASINDGRSAWEEVVRGIRATMDDPSRGLPGVGLIFAGLLVVWINIRLARMLLRDPPDHHAPVTHDDHGATRPVHHGHTITRA